MSKLTKEQKSSVVSKVLKATFADRQAALTAQMQDLGDSIWESLYGHLKEQISALPEGFLSWNITIPVHFDGSPSRWSFDQVGMTTSRAMPTAVARSNQAAVSYDLDHKFAKEHRRLCEIKEQIAADTKMLKSKLEGLFYSINTRKQAITAWPECEKYLPAEPPVVKNLPIIPVEGLNELIASMTGGAR